MQQTSHSQSKNIVLIGYGNRLRNDDGVGQVVANTVAAWKLPNVQAIATHQLTPELAEILATADFAIFCDADTNTSQVQVHFLEVASSRMLTSHCCEPQTLLAIAQILYGFSPCSCLVKIPAINFNLGDRLSTVAQHGMAQALTEIESLMLQQGVIYA